MDLKSIEYFTGKFSALLHIPICVIEKNNKIYDPGIFTLDFNIDLSKLHWPVLSDTKENIQTVLTPNLIMFGSVKVQDTPYHIVFGPCRSVPINQKMVKSIISEYNLDKTIEVSDMSRYFQSISQTPIETFASILVSVNTLVNNEIVENSDLYNETIPYDIHSDVYQELLNHTETMEYEAVSTIPEYDFERQVIFFVRHGLSNQLFNHMRKGYRGRNSILADEPLRQYKNRCISLTTLVSRAAMEGGLDSDTAYELFDVYIRRIELAQNIKALNLIQKTMLYDYCNRVQTVNYGYIEDPTINRAIVYINENVHNKILARDIAETLNINPGYLSVKFKKVTGISLPDFINNLKIIEAKRLLLFSDLSLAKITYHLSFSSQSYFQNLFKKVTGVTPRKYRKHPNDQNVHFFSKSND